MRERHVSVSLVRVGFQLSTVYACPEYAEDERLKSKLRPMQLKISTFLQANIVASILVHDVRDPTLGSPLACNMHISGTTLGLER